MTGTRASSAMRETRLLPPRGMMTSTNSSRASSAPTAARSVVPTSCTAVSGSPPAASPSRTAPRDRAVRAHRLAAAAQDHRVARLEADTGGVGGDVRARLVDHADDAERHAHAGDLEPRRLTLARRQRPDRIGLCGDAAKARGHARHPRRRQLQAIEQRRREATLAGACQVVGVGRDQRLGIALDRLGDRVQRGVLAGGGCVRERLARRPCALAERAYVSDGIGRALVRDALARRGAGRGVGRGVGGDVVERRHGSFL